jgi:hypothetical protein
VERCMLRVGDDLHGGHDGCPQRDGDVCGRAADVVCVARGCRVGFGVEFSGRDQLRRDLLGVLQQWDVGDTDGGACCRVDVHGLVG